MLKKLGIISALCLGLMGCQNVYEETIGIEENVEPSEPQKIENQPAPKIRLKKTPDTIIVCRNKQCAASKLANSKEYIYNTLLHMLDSNARKKALVCQADSNTHSCIEQYVSVPLTVGITPAYMYIDDVKITDVSISPKNTAALDLILNWGVSYNGQTPTCRPSKTLLYVKNVNNAIMEDNGYECKMTTIGSSTIKTLFAIDYIDLDYDYIGGFFSVGVSGPAFGGDSGYMIIRLPEDISVDPKDFQPEPKKEKTTVKKAESKVEANTQKVVNAQPVVAAASAVSMPQNNGVMPVNAPAQAGAPVAPAVSAPVKNPAPNVDTIIRYNHAARDYDQAKADMEAQRKKEYEEYEKWKFEQAEAVDFQGVKVLPVPLKKAEPASEPVKKNSLNDYQTETQK